MQNGFYIYRFLNNKNEIVYVGKTTNLKNRFKQHSHLTKEVVKIEYIECASEADMTWKEIYYINLYKNNNTTNIASVCNDDVTEYDFGDIWIEYIEEPIIYKEYEIRERIICNEIDKYYYNPKAKYINPDLQFKYVKYNDNLNVNDLYVISFESFHTCLPCYYKGGGYYLDENKELREYTTETLRDAALYTLKDACEVAKILNNNIKLIWNIDLDETAKYRNVPFISNINIEEDKKIRDRFKNRNANKQELEFVLIPDFIDENGMPDKDYYKLLNSLLTF